MPKPHKPTHLTEHVQTLILAALRNGSYFETAAAFAGVSRDSLWRWLRDGRRNPEGPTGEFARLCDKAIAEAELSHLRNIRDAGQTDWRASAWVLMHRHPERWKSVQSDKEEGDSPRAILVLPARLTPEEYERQWIRENKEKTH